MKNREDNLVAKIERSIPLPFHLRVSCPSPKENQFKKNPKCKISPKSSRKIKVRRSKQPKFKTIARSKST
jgi:hypothetical protein